MYKEYLGEKANELPSSGLLFPLNVKIKNSENGATSEVVRTLLAVDDEKNSMTFLGDIPEGPTARLMKANIERFINGAQNAAALSTNNLNKKNVDLAILISCVGRKLVLKGRVEEEVEVVQAELGKDVMLSGFYSYGEISPLTPSAKQCQLNNQTMTITTFKEE